MLLPSLKAFNAAATYAAKVAFDQRVFSQQSIRTRGYDELRQRFARSAQMATRAMGKAVEALKQNRTPARYSNKRVRWYTMNT